MMYIKQIMTLPCFLCCSESYLIRNCDRFSHDEAHMIMFDFSMIPINLQHNNNMLTWSQDNKDLKTQITKVTSLEK